MKSKILPIIAICIVLASSAMVLATSTLNSPVAGGNYSATMIVNCTTDVAEALNATIFYNQTGGATGTSLTTIVNDTASDTEFYNAAVSIAALTDATTYNISCYVDNSTDQEYSAGIASVTIDNTNPTVSVSTDKSTISTGRVIIYTTSIADATSGISSQSCTATDPEGSTTTLSTSANKVSFDTAGNIDAGTWTFSCTATDYAGNSNTASTTVTSKDSGAAAPTGPTAPISPSVAIGIGAAIAAAFVLFGKK